MAKTKKAVPCNLCDKTFSTVGGRASHMKAKHSANLPSNTSQQSTTFSANVPAQRTDSITFNCVQCNESFETEEDRQRHYRESGFLQCPRCLQLVANRSALNRHMMSAHLARCLRCDRSLYEEELKRHYIIFPDHRSYTIRYTELSDVSELDKQRHLARSNVVQCLLCHQRYQDEHALEQRFDDSPAHPRCEICGLEFSDEAAHSQHIAVAHTPIFRCYLCKLDFGSREDRAQHYHESVSHPKCARCLVPFENAIAYSAHMWGEHLVQCEHCGGAIFRDEVQKHYDESDKHPNCDVCNMGFPTMKLHGEHVQFAHPRCNPCDRIFQTEAGLEQHYRETPAHPKCALCDAGFRDDTAYEDHMLDTHFVKCRLREQQVLRSEWRKHYLFEDHPRCISCNTGFNDLYLLKQHRKSAHPDLFCTFCDRLFPTKDSFEQHATLAHYDLRCILCLRLFQSRDALEQHLRDAPAFPHCDICGAGFSNDVALTLHKTTVHAQGFKCYICNLGFTDKAERDQHYRETKSHPRCALCTLAFENSIDYFSHMWDVHLVQCELCNCGVFRDVLQKHCDESDKHPKCTVCHVGFLTAELHEKHVQTTHPRCEHCNRVFRTKAELDQHCKDLPGHHGCNVCRAFFPSLKNLKAHRKTAQPVQANQPLLADAQIAAVTVPEPADTSISPLNLFSNNLGKDTDEPSATDDVVVSDAFPLHEELQTTARVKQNLVDDHQLSNDARERGMQSMTASSEPRFQPVREISLVTPQSGSAQSTSVSSKTLSPNAAIDPRAVDRSASINCAIAVLSQQPFSQSGEASDRVHADLFLRPASIISHASVDSANPNNQSTSDFSLPLECVNVERADRAASLRDLARDEPDRQEISLPVYPSPNPPAFEHSVNLSPTVRFPERSGGVAATIAKTQAHVHAADERPHPASEPLHSRSAGPRTLASRNAREDPTSDIESSRFHSMPRPENGPSWHCRSCLKNSCDQPTATMCGHVFCHSCIVKELATNMQCPVCKTVMLLRMQVGPNEYKT